jgi:hypothetical protein
MLEREYPELLRIDDPGHRTHIEEQIKRRIIAACQDCWKCIPNNVFENAARNMYKRLQALQKTGGWYTKN